MGLEIIDKFLSFLNASNATKEELEKNKNVELELESSFQIFIKDIDNKTKVVEISRGDTIKTLWLKIKEKTSIEGKRLQFGGKPLSKDNLTVEDYNIQKNATLQLLGRLKGGAILPTKRSEEAALVVQGKVKESLKKDLHKELKLSNNEAHKVDFIIDFAANPKKGVIYSEESLKYFMKEAKEGNEAMKPLLFEVEAVAKRLLEIVDESFKGKKDREKYKKNDKKTIEVGIGKVDAQYNKLNEKSLPKEIKDVYKKMGNVIDKAKTCYAQDNNGLYATTVLNAFKSWPYYTLNTPYLILCKSKDLPLLEVYEAENLVAKGEKKEEEPIREAIKFFYLGIYSTLASLSNLIKDAGNINSYYLKVLKELNSGKRLDENLETLKSAMGETARNFSNEELDKRCELLVDVPIMKLPELGETLPKVLGELGELSAAKRMGEEESDKTYLAFGAAKAVFDGILNLKSAFDKIDINNQYWQKQLDIINKSLSSIPEMQKELKRRASFFRKIEVLFLEKQPMGASENTKELTYRDMGSLKSTVPFVYNTLRSAIYRDIISKLHRWGESGFEINPNNFTDFLDTEVERIVVKVLDKRAKNFSVKNKELILGKFDNKEYKKEAFLEELNKAVWKEVKEMLTLDVNKDHSFWASLKASLWADKEIKYTTKDKNKKDVVTLSVKEFAAENKLIKTDYDEYQKLMKAQCNTMFLDTDFESVKETLKTWTRAKDITKLKDNTNFKQIIFANYNIVDFASDIDKMSGVSDKLRVSLLAMNKLTSVLSDQNGKEVITDALEGKKKLAKAVLSSLEIALGVGAGATAMLFPPIAPVLAGLLGVVKLINVGVDTAISHYITKQEGKFEMGNFIGEINNLNDIIQNFQKKLSSYIDNLFDIWALRSNILQKLEAKK